MMSAPLAEVDPDIAELLDKELAPATRHPGDDRLGELRAPLGAAGPGQRADQQVRRGLPGRRYYGGCEHVDVVENIALDRAKALFGAEFANVQPHSGAQANAAVLHALMTPGEHLLGLDLANGGHLTHGMKLNFSGKLYDVGFYGVDPKTHLVDMDAVRAKALEFRPKVIIAGWSAYPRQLDFARVPVDRRRGRRQAVGGHGALRRAGCRGPAPVAGAARRRGVHHRAQDARRRPLRHDPGQAGDTPRPSTRRCSPASRAARCMHVIAGKAVAFKIAATPEFADRQQRTLSGARILAERLLAADVAKAGVSVVSGGTDVHLVLVDLRDSPLDGKAAEDLLHDDRHHRQPQRRPERPPAADGDVRPADRNARRWPPAASATPSSPRSPTSSPPPWRPAPPRTSRRCGNG